MRERKKYVRNEATPFRRPSHPKPRHSQGRPRSAGNSRGLYSSLSSAWTWAGLEGASSRLKGGPWPSAHTSSSVAVSSPSRRGGAPSRTCSLVGGRRRGAQSFTSVTVMLRVAVADRGGAPRSTATTHATPSPPDGASRSRARRRLTVPSAPTFRASQPPSTRKSTCCRPPWGGGS